MRGHSDSGEYARYEIRRRALSGHGPTRKSIDDCAGSGFDLDEGPMLYGWALLDNVQPQHARRAESKSTATSPASSAGISAARARQYSSSFNKALWKLSEHGIGTSLTLCALQTWHRFCAEANPPEPTLERTNDGGLRFAWTSTSRYYLDAEVYDDGTVEWFFEDRETEDTDGTSEDREADFPIRFFDYLRTLSK